MAGKEGFTDEGNILQKGNSGRSARGQRHALQRLTSKGGKPRPENRHRKARGVLVGVKPEREKAEKKLLMKLQEAEEAVRDESVWMSLDELKKSVGV